MTAKFQNHAAAELAGPVADLPARPASGTRQAYSIEGFCEAYGVGRTKAYEEIATGRLKARKAGRRTIIPAAEAERWLGALPELGA